MAVLKFSPEADDLLTELESDPRMVRGAARLNTALDKLEADPGTAVNRRRRFQSLDLWAIPVVCGGDEWLILWKQGEGDHVIVAHIVPAP